MNRGKGFLTVGENFVTLVGIGAILFVAFSIAGNVAELAAGVEYAVSIMQWFFMRIAAIILIALGMVLLTVYGVAEIFSRRQYKPVPPRAVSYRVDGPAQLPEGESMSLFQPSDGDDNIIEGTAKLIGEFIEPEDIY